MAQFKPGETPQGAIPISEATAKEMQARSAEARKRNRTLREATLAALQEDGGGYVTIISEPQLWYNFGEHFALGGEVELSKGFISPDFKALPCVGFKWTF